jgi:hypothetical protein
MEEQQSLPPAPSLGSTFMNVFTSPSEAFEGLATSASSAKLWLIPFIVTLLLAIAATFVVSNVELLRAQIIEQQEKQLDKALQENKISQERYDQTINQMEKMGAMFVVFGSIGAVVVISLMFFLYTLLLWLGDKFILKASAGYSKHLELYGISSWIAILGTVISIGMMIGFGSMYAGPSAALFVLNEFDPSVKIHGLLAALNIFGLWQTAVVGFGLSKFSGKSVGMSVGISFVVWAIWTFLLVLLGMSR